jgi:hypothetical protein
MAYKTRTGKSGERFLWAGETPSAGRADTLCKRGGRTRSLEESPGSAHRDGAESVVESAKPGRPRVDVSLISRDLALKKLRDSFPDMRTAVEALEIPNGYGTRPWHRERERVQLAMLMQSGGDLDRLRELAALADRDYRDALVGAEFPEQFQHASSKTSPAELEAIRRRDQQHYEAWLNSGGARTLRDAMDGRDEK